MQEPIFHQLQAGVNKCLRMVETSSTKDHLQGTTRYLHLFADRWEFKLARIKDDDLDIALEAAIEVILERLHDKELSFAV